MKAIGGQACSHALLPISNGPSVLAPFESREFESRLQFALGITHRAFEPGLGSHQLPHEAGRSSFRDCSINCLLQLHTACWQV